MKIGTVVRLGPQVEGLTPPHRFSAIRDMARRMEADSLDSITIFRNPALLAKMAATLDEVSDGRLILGLGAGWHRPQFDAFGYPYDHRASRFEEALQIISPVVERTSLIW